MITAVDLSGGESGTLGSISLGSLRWSPASQQSFLPLRNKLIKRGPEARNFFVRVFYGSNYFEVFGKLNVVDFQKKIRMD